MTLTEPPVTQTPHPVRETPPKADRKVGYKVGYIVAIGVNALMLYIANNLLEWDWFPWLTSEFDRVLPWIVFSLGASILVNAMYLFYDLAWFKSLTQAALAIITVVVTMRLYLIFPFDFSAYDGPWTGLTEAVLIIFTIGAGIAAMVEGTKFLIRLAHPVR